MNVDKSDSQLCIVLTTVADEEKAHQISQSLIETKMAACVNIVSNITSIYRWKEKVENSNEFLLVIKTFVSKFEDLQKHLLSIHPYEVPEIVCINTSCVFDKYLAWVKTEIKE